MVDAASIAAPAISFVISGALFLLDWEVDSLVTPVKTGKNPREEFDTQERRLIHWSLAPIFRGKVRAGTTNDVQYDEVGPTYNQTLEQIHLGRESLDLLDEEITDIKRAVKLAAASLLPLGAYTAVLVAYPQYDAWLIIGAMASLAAFAGLASIGFYAYLVMRRVRKTCRDMIDAVNTTLNTLQTVLVSNGVT